MTTPSFTNRLIHEKSPYLLQHSHDPVDWFPWSQEAFDLAKKLDKPIFLSIGYATCHWCHAMGKESFENADIAQMMNEAFINIKVDREELPEVDSIYMEFAQALMSSAGGWPLNLLLTPDLKPFFAVTYLPPVNRKGLIGMTQFIRHIEQLWKGEERSQLVEQANKIVSLFEEASKVDGDELPTEQNLSLSAEMLFELMDPVYGGLKGEPKFPMGYQALFLLEYAKRKGESRALFCVELTLDRMQRGGIYDQLGGGFSRYAVDQKWVIPHFEKMLYDNAILTCSYLEAWKYTQNERFKEVVQETLHYLLTEMRHPEGGFFSAEDADSEGHEGTFYTWAPFEIRELLSHEEADIFCQYYGVSHPGNFEGKSVLHVAHPLEEFCDDRELSLNEIQPILTRAKSLVLKRRSLRPRPFKDDKIIASWNGLMIDVLAKASSALQHFQYLEDAVKTASFLKNHLWKDGKLYRRFREGETRFNGGLDDYAFLIKGLISLFEAGAGSAWLKWALELAEILFSHFKHEKGAFYYTLEDPALLIRKCEFYDGAEPSGNAVHCENLLRLFQITCENRYLSQAEDILKAAKQHIEIYPPGACYHLRVLQRYLDSKASTIVVALDEERSLEKEIHQALSHRFLPHASIIWKAPRDLEIVALVPSLVDKNPVDGQTAIYICRQNLCEQPLIDKTQILNAIAAL